MPNKNDEIMFVDIDKLDNDLWDSRSYSNAKKRQTIEEKVKELAESIKQEGLHTPIIIARPKSNGHYSIVTGRLRTRAHKKLGLKTIKCIFTDETDKDKLADITYSENDKRSNLTLDDQLLRIRSIFEQNGYPLSDAIRFAKSLYNASNNENISKIKVPEKFKKLLEKLPKLGNDKPPSHNTLYAILSTMVHNEREVQDLFEEYGLSLQKRVWLGNTKLRKRPTIQKSLITEIAGMSPEKARIVIAQKIRDIETGALVKTGEDSYTIDFDKREKIDTRIHVVKNSVEKYLEILDKTQRLIFSLTGHKKTQNEIEYEQKHIDLTEPYRIDILKGLSPQQKTTLFKDLTLLSDAIDSFIDIIENESADDEGKKKKEELIKNE